MAACTTNYFGSECGWSPQVSEWNRKSFERQLSKRRGAQTPEFHFQKHFDNSRLVKAPDPAKARQMRVFSAALALLFCLIMVYGLQHFSAIESSYKVEAEKQTRDKLREENRQLRLSEAQLTQPVRIDSMARELGLVEPRPGQVIHSSNHPDADAPAIAQINPPALRAQ